MFLGRDLVARHLEHVLAGADERDAGRSCRLGELGVLGEESVARVDRVCAALASDADDLGDVEVGRDRVPLLADLVGLVGLQAMHRVAILVRENGHRLGAEFIGGPERSDRDFAAVGHEDLLEHLVLSVSRKPRTGRAASGL